MGIAGMFMRGPFVWVGRTIQRRVSSDCIIVSMLLLIGLLGLILGGVINALADSLPHLRKPQLPRCPHCGARRPLSAWLGVLAWPLGVWRCPECDKRRSLRTVIVEGVAIVGAVLLYLRDPSAISLGSGLLVGFVFLLITVIDIEHRLILEVISLPSMAIFGIIGILSPEFGWWKTLLGGLVGFGIVLGLFFLGNFFGRWVAIRRGQELDEVAFGFGDVMLAALIGLIVGWPGVIVAILLGVFAAGAFSLLYILITMLKRQYTPYQAIPYGPFLILGAAFIYYGGADLLRIAYGM
jgi:prepilin signal peptidase PulO-like enzyme (type II secretory pathway)